MKSRVCLLIMAEIVWTCSVVGQQPRGTPPLDTPVKHESKSGELTDVLAFVALRYHVPMIVEIVQPFPVRVEVAAGNDTARQVLDSIVKQSPGYAWLDERGVPVILRRVSVASPGNVFATRLHTFTMPRNVAELAIVLAQAMSHPNERLTGFTGGLMPKELTDLKLAEGTILRDVTGRDVLVEACRENHNIFSIALFPSPKRTDIPAKEYVLRNWFMRSSQSFATTPLYLRSIPVNEQQLQ